jgi:hypothetical protein
LARAASRAARTVIALPRAVIALPRAVIALPRAVIALPRAVIAPGRAVIALARVSVTAPTRSSGQAAQADRRASSTLIGFAWERWSCTFGTAISLTHILALLDSIVNGA